MFEVLDDGGFKAIDRLLDGPAPIFRETSLHTLDRLLPVNSGNLLSLHSFRLLQCTARVVALPQPFS